MAGQQRYQFWTGTAYDDVCGEVELGVLFGKVGKLDAGLADLGDQLELFVRGKWVYVEAIGASTGAAVLLSGIVGRLLSPEALDVGLDALGGIDVGRVAQRAQALGGEGPQAVLGRGAIDLVLGKVHGVGARGSGAQRRAGSGR